jgi:4-oxalomesaconate tautomerase
MIMRGGSSKGAYFLADDLPDDPAERADLLRRIMGSPDPRQIDGMGGAHPLTSKVAIVAPADDDGVDVDYLFLQVGVDDEVVTDRQNCGNLLAGVGPFALERGLVDAGDDTELTVSIRMLNTGSLATASLSIEGGTPVYGGDTEISGVPGTASAIRLDFDDIVGSSTGALLPTGNPTDVIQGVRCTLIDCGMPVVVMRADALGVAGDETCADLEANDGLRRTLEAIRLDAGALMHLGDVGDATVPKLTLVAPPTAGGHLATRTFIPHRCHDAIGVLGAISVAASVFVDGSPAAECAIAPPTGHVRLEHPTGTFDAVVEPGEADDGSLTVERAGIVRTARKLMDGTVFPRSG